MGKIVFEQPQKQISTVVNLIIWLFQNCSKFNPSLYGPCILPPRSKAGIMQTFINNKGKVNAFKTTSDNVVTLRKPQVYKVRQYQFSH